MRTRIKNALFSVMVLSWVMAALEGILFIDRCKWHPGRRLISDHIWDRTPFGWLSLAYLVALNYHILSGLLGSTASPKGGVGLGVRLSDRSTARLASGKRLGLPGASRVSGAQVGAPGQRGAVGQPRKR